MKITLVGCRGFGRVHLNAYTELRKEEIGKDLEIYVFSRTEEFAKECMKEFDANGYFTSYDDVLKSDANIIDLVVSHDAHETMGVKAMQAGKNVMIEKPIARTEEEAQSLINTSIKKGVKFMVLENHYFDPTVWKAKELMASLGKISLIIVRNTRRNSPPGWRRDKRLMGGGALIDGGIHYIDTMLNLGGEYSEIKGLCKNTFSGLEGEDTSGGIFNFKGGYLGIFMYSWASKSENFSHFEIYGERGSIKEDGVIYSGKPYGNLIVDIEGIKEKMIQIEKINTVKEEIKGFINALIHNNEVPMNPKIALRDLIAVREIYRQCGEI
ncbi:Gfo/Idh/MocA family protein [Acidianus manzaensis]|uniref:Dehydrogenase n=1 Tax=Acidianus manzaensis TaxID=282676 RepID=A0A1W6JY70_9CREN|nr:Gfo/Idh/MocA family oxidoreductase [Acidianus manzaensis]ARM75226.1 dehydrogenase [Acidianus manzaensis]